jgi:putative FmdB family regulatory protein
MPIYEYECGACAHRFEALLSRSGEDPPSCPRCGGTRVEKRLSTFAVTRGASQAPPGSCGGEDCARCPMAER